MNKLTYLLLCLVLGIGLATAQTRKVTGTVISTEDSEPIIGASVIVKGTTTGTVTDFDGAFSLDVPSSAKTLVISYVGMIAREVPVQDVLRVVLQSGTQNLEEVVVTAIGMKKQEKALGYAASTVKGDDLAAARSGSVMSGLTGKVAGVNITSSGGTGSSQKVIVRGLSSFNANQPLYVVDGVPIQNDFQGVGDMNNAVDFGNQANDINPEDVESVTVLKGASATALYGSRAANGVIMITTKRAGAEKLSVTYDGSFMASNVLRVPQTQDRFGQGWPDWSPSENGSWGPALDGREHAWGAFSDGTPGDLEPMTKKYSYVDNNLRNFFDTGFETNNNISLRMGNDKLGLVASYGNMTSNGVLPNNADKYQRNTFSLRGNLKYKRFYSEININYVRKDITTPSTGQGKDGASIFNDIIQHGVDIDISSAADYTNPYYSQDNYYTPWASNPYWILDNNKNVYQDDRVYGKIEMAFDIMDGLKAVGRLGGDFTNSRQTRWNEKVILTPGSWSAIWGKTPQVGTYRERTDNLGQIDATAFLSADYKIGEDIALSGIAGWNLNQRTSSYLDSYLYGLQQVGWFSLDNGADKPQTKSYRKARRLVGLFAQAEFGYKNFWFVNASLRNDWSSTLPKGKNSFFYGGVNTSLIITDLFEDLKSDALNFLKVRAAWGKTGNDADPYATSAYYIPTQISMGFGDLYLPLNGAMGMTEYNRLPNTNLKPEITTEWELGITSHLWNNRINVDVAYYDKITKDQIISANLSPETRYTSMTRNVGKISNRGIEAMFSVIPVQTKDWEWEVGMTFSKNWSEVKELWDGANEYVLTGINMGAGSVDFVAEVGQPLGVFKVPQMAKTEDGKTIVNGAGIPTVDGSKKETIGSSTPNFLMGINTRLSWKGFTLSAVFDWRNGGYFYSHTASTLAFAGNATYTVFNERQSFVVPNSVRLVNGQYVENNIPITRSNTYNYYNNSTNADQYRNWVLPKDYMKLKELTLSYSFPKSLLSKTPLTALQVSLIGRNLFMWTPKRNNYVDPESTNYGNDIKSDFGEYASSPTTRTFGGGIKVTF